MSSLSPSCSASNKVIEVREGEKLVGRMFPLEPPIYPIGLPSVDAANVYVQLYRIYCDTCVTLAGSAVGSGFGSVSDALSEADGFAGSCVQPEVVRKSRRRRGKRRSRSAGSAASVESSQVTYSLPECAGYVGASPGLDRHRFDTGGVGFCYLPLFQAVYRDKARRDLGAYPTFAALLGRANWFTSAEEIAQYQVYRSAAGVYHLGTVGVPADQVLKVVAAVNGEYLRGFDHVPLRDDLIRKNNGPTMACVLGGAALGKLAGAAPCLFGSDSVKCRRDEVVSVTCGSWLLAGDDYLSVTHPHEFLQACALPFGGDWRPAWTAVAARAQWQQRTDDLWEVKHLFAPPADLLQKLVCDVHNVPCDWHTREPYAGVAWCSGAECDYVRRGIVDWDFVTDVAVDGIAYEDVATVVD